MTEPEFQALPSALTGIQFMKVIDEGALFFDYDMDADQDLFVLYTNGRNRILENRGDATFSWDPAALEALRMGSIEGCSAEDWDLDGDLDLSTTEIFRRNTLVEAGARFLRLANHDIPSSHLGLTSPAWGDWDRDGDPDCILATRLKPSFLYRNTTYDSSTPPSENRSIRVRVVRDSPSTERGLETEFGATVELRVHGDTSGLVRRRFVASSHGYLQQSEYALTLALPPGPNPSRPVEGVFFDLSVDFPSLPPNGLLRIDPLVNPALGGIVLERLENREITIYRSGKVIVNGVPHPPRTTDFSRRLSTTSPLALADLGAPLSDPAPAPASSWWIGVELDLKGAKGPALTQELVLDGVLEPGTGGSGDFNVALWNVAGDRPRRIWAASLETSPRNHRSFLPVSFRLGPNQRYRLVARVTELRASPTEAPTSDEPVRTIGGLSYQDLDPQSGLAAKVALVDPSQVYLALRYRGPK